MSRFLSLAAICVLTLSAADDYERRVREVSKTPGFVALWDFVKRDGGRFDAWKARGDVHDFRLDAVNYVRDYWGQGRAATYDDFPLLGSGPFGQAVHIVNEKDPDFRPCLLVPRARLHGSGLDVKGPGKSVSLVVWLQRESGNHAIAGIWHEGTDLNSEGQQVKRVEHGMRQYALFAGLAANNGAVAAHVSENGAKSFGDKYARNLATTPQLLGREWSVAAFAFDNAKNTVTAYIDGVATDYWIDNPEKHPFFQWPYKGWVRAHQPGADKVPANELYAPPEGRPLRKTVLQSNGGERVELHEFAFTKVRVTLRGKQVLKRELVALKANPFWFGHDLYSPKELADGGPFTIGRVIHTSRSVGFTGYIGGVAVFGRALSKMDMERLAAIGKGRMIQAK